MGETMSTVTRVYKNVKGIRTAIKDVARLRQIGVVLAKHGFGAIVKQLRLADVTGIGNLTESIDPDSSKYSVPERIRLAIEDLGPTFIKLGQILSTRPDLVPPSVIEQLQHLQNDVPPMPTADVEEQVQSQLGKPLADCFASFELEPLACASIAQAHRATLPDGTEIVVKVKRRHIDQKIDSDLNILHFLAARAEQLVPELQLADPVGIVKEFDRALRQELDFTVECENIQRFTRNFKNFEGIRAPAVYPDYCTRELMTMEFISGVKITQAAEKVDADPYVFAPLVLKALLKMILEDGHVHGDLHPGNILIQEGGEIVLIDFGLCGRLLPRQREDILDLLLAVAKEDYEGVARTIFEMGIKLPGVRYDFVAFEGDVVDIMERHVLGKTLASIDVQAYFADLVAGAIRHQIKMPANYTMVFKALMTVEGIGKTLAPEMNFLDETRPYVQGMIVERYNPKRLLKETVELVGSVTRFTRQVSQSGPQLIRHLERGELGFRAEITNLERSMDLQRLETRLQTRSILVVGLLISGTLSLNFIHETLQLPLLSLGSYSLAALLGIPAILNLLRRK